MPFPLPERLVSAVSFRLLALLRNRKSYFALRSTSVGFRPRAKILSTILSLKLGHDPGGPETPTPVCATIFGFDRLLVHQFVAVGRGHRPGAVDPIRGERAAGKSGPAGSSLMPGTLGVLAEGDGQAVIVAADIAGGGRIAEAGPVAGDEMFRHGGDSAAEPGEGKPVSSMLA